MALSKPIVPVTFEVNGEKIPIDISSWNFIVQVQWQPILNENRKLVPKVWGWEDWIINSEAYCGKLLFIKKGHYTSWHYHKKKDECFYLQKGKLKVYHSPYDLYKNNIQTLHLADTKILKKGDSLHMPVEQRHRLEAIKDCYLFEFSTHHEDSDSIRIIGGA